MDLETREQPGSVLSGLAAGTVVDPLATISLIAGDNAFQAPPENPPTVAAAAHDELPPNDSLALAPSSTATNTPQADSLDQSQTVDSDAAGSVRSLDLSDLSFPNSDPFAVPVMAGDGPAADGSAGQPGAPAFVPPDAFTPTGEFAPAAGVNAGSADDQSVAPSAAGGASQSASISVPPTTKVPAAPVAGAGPADFGPAPVMPLVIEDAPDRATVRTADGRATVSLDAHGHTLDAVTASKASTGGPALPFGLFGFNVSGLAPGGIAQVDLTLPTGSHPDGYFKQDPATGALTRFAFDGTTGAVVRGNVVTLYLQDGGRGDADGVANGVVVDPGGPGGGGASDHLVISQVYGAGGDDGAAFNQDFVELFNPTGSTADLSGLSVQYADAGSDAWTVVSLAGTLDPGHYYLIGGASGATGAALPTPDLTSAVDLAADSGKVALVTGTTALVGAVPDGTNVVDLAGYGAADWFEGTGPAPATDAGDAALRLGAGNYDTDDNGWDFTADVPDPRNTGSAAANLMPHVTVPDTLWTPADTALAVSGITVTDPDAGTSPLAITLDADQGTLTLGGTAGLTFTDGTGTGDASMTFTGTLTDIGTALAGLTYTPAAGYHGAGGISVWADDQGNTGAGGSLVDFGVLTVAVGGQVVAVDQSSDGTEDTATTIDVLANDVWVGESTPALTVSTAPAHGTATVGADGIDYTPNVEWSGTDTFAYTLDDGLGHTSTATVTVNVAQVNDAAIDTSGDPNMYADEGALVDETFTTPDATEPITWAASGLPDGLSINPTTGEIAGRPQYDQAGAHAFSLTATAADGDTDTVNLTWNVTDVNRIPWIDDQATQGGEQTNIDYYARDAIGNPVTYSFSGLPAGMSGPNNAIPPGAAGDFDVTVSVTGGGATDTRSYHWKIVPAAHGIFPGHTPAAGVASFAQNGTLVHSDDVGLVGLPMPVTVKLFLTELDYMNVGNNSLAQIKLEVVTGDAGLTTDPDDTVGSGSIVVSPSSSISPDEVFVDAYLDGHAPSGATDDYMIVAYRIVNNAWVLMDGAGKDNEVKTIKVGTHLDDDGTPDHLWDGVIDANTTPAAMWQNNRNLYRIPPRNWNATDLWVTKDGVIGEDKFLWLDAPVAGAPELDAGTGQSPDNGKVALNKLGQGDPNVNSYVVRLLDGDFTAPAIDGEKTAKYYIRGHVDAKSGTIYQTQPGHANKLLLRIFSSADIKAKLDQTLYTSQKFSVAAIPTQVVMIYKGKREAFDFGETLGWGTYFENTFTSDSGFMSDLNKVRQREKAVKPDPRVNSAAGAWADIAKQTGAWLYIGDPDGAIDNHTLEWETRNRRDGVNKTIAVIKALGAGSATIKQSFEFRDERTGGTAAPPTYTIQKSGFEITMDLQLTGGKPQMTLTKVGKAVNGADAGTVEGTQPGQFEVK